MKLPLKIFVLAALLLAPCGVLHAAEELPVRPNVLFLFADDQRADTIAALGNPVIKTPNLDCLAHRGLAFTRSYMQGGFNAATCVPSRAMLLSGRNLFHIHEKLEHEGKFDDTWPAAFGRAGYTTFMTGKWHNGAAAVPHSFQIARSVFAGGMGNPMKLELSDMVDGKLTPPKVAAKHSIATFADEAIRFLKEHDSGPFFAYVPFDAPHDPHIVPPDFTFSYDPAQIPLPPDFLPLHPWDNGEMKIRDEKLMPWPRTAEGVKTYLADYYRYITYLDAQIGRILDALAASPYASNTIVVFSADSGAACGSHGLIGKQNLYEHSVRVPLIIAGPGIPANKRTDAMCYLFDVLPTVGKVCGIKGPETGDGIDFSTSLDDPAKPARSSMVFAYKNVQRAVRDDRWKLIRYPQVDKTQLFDLKADPLEIHNLAEDTEYAAKTSELTALLEKELNRSGDTCDLKVSGSGSADRVLPAKELPLPGEVFPVAGRPAFLIAASGEATGKSNPWVWYAPTLPNLPGPEERWMFEKFRDAGIAIAGIDVGESNGSPAGRALFSQLYVEMTERRGYSRKPVLLGRSRGGLMTLAWAAENPDKVAAFAGIYPVSNISSYPGVAKAAAAYELKPEELLSSLSLHNPIDRLAPLAKAGVPLFAIHGDSDKVVPLEDNSGLLKDRYEALGGSMHLIVPPGQGHNLWQGFFQCRELVEFVLTHARP